MTEFDTDDAAPKTNPRKSWSVCGVCYSVVTNREAHLVVMHPETPDTITPEEPLGSQETDDAAGVNTAEEATTDGA